MNSSIASGLEFLIFETQDVLPELTSLKYTFLDILRGRVISQCFIKRGGN